MGQVRHGSATTTGAGQHDVVAMAARAGRVVTYNVVRDAVPDLAILLVGHCAGGSEKRSADLVDEVNRACKGH